MLRELFIERARDYRAGLHSCTGGDLAAVIAGLLAEASGIVVPPGLPEAWLTATTLPRLDGDLTPARLDAPGLVVVTGCTLAIAETGTLVLDHGPGQGPRLLTLIPDHHICVVHTHQIVADVPDMISGLADPARPITMISGPSATSDIELNRVEGVHGPRHLDIICV
jgi:L-lactate dehydrogenase complex protein LldG